MARGKGKVVWQKAPPTFCSSEKHSLVCKSKRSDKTTLEEGAETWRLGNQTTMGKFQCHCCKRYFASSSLLRQHLASDKAVRCHQHYYGGGDVAARPMASNFSANSNKKQKTIQEIESVLQRSLAASSLRQQTLPPQQQAQPSFDNASDTPIDSSGPLEDSSGPLEMDDFDYADDGFVCDDGVSDAVPSLVPDATPGLSEQSDKFKEYVARAARDNREFQPNWRAAIELMSLMDNKGGSIELYKAVLNWHVRNLEGNQHEKVSPDNLHKTLIERYGMKDVMPYELKVELQSQKGIVPIVCHNCEAQTMDLLTDPRLRPTDLLFPGPPEDRWTPPNDVLMIADIDTGAAYRRTYKALIEPMPYTKCGRKRVLLPYIFYLDSCVTGQNQNQEVEILKFTIGLFNQRARRQKWAWRELGFIHHAAKGKGQAKNLLKNSNHIDSANYVKDPSYREAFATQYKEEIPDLEHFGVIHTNNTPDATVVAQDLHKQLKVIMHSYKNVEEAGGINHDLVVDGEAPEKLRLVPHIIFFKVDGKEGDKLCLQYQSKTERVESLCNICCCPTLESHDAYRNDPPKTVPMIRALVEQGKGKELKLLSQQLAVNALHDFRFGLHNDRGIHGATHLEALHSIQLGQFGYSRSTFFLQTGESSILSTKINTLASAVATYLERQSDKTLPRTSLFITKGVQSGTVTGHEMAGLILVLGLTIRVTEGRNTLLQQARGKQNVYFPDEEAVRQWTVLLETQLMYEAWVKSEEMEVSLVKRADTKMREYMNMCKLVMKRDILKEGMGHNTKNHHGQKHLAESILDYGVPENINTFDNERHHKPDKRTAQRTQKQAEKFDIQMGNKVQQCRAVALGVEELEGKKKWQYFKKRVAEDEGDDVPYFDPTLGGVRWTVSKIRGTSDMEAVNKSNNKTKQRISLEEYTYFILTELLDRCSNLLNKLDVYDELRVFDESSDNRTQIYRASPMYEGKPWYSWAIFDLSVSEEQRWHRNMPCQIKAFVDLTELPPEAEASVGLSSGLYALVEVTYPNPDIQEHRRSKLWYPVVKKASTMTSFAGTNCLMELVSIDQLMGPATVVPDHGNEDNRAFLRLVRPTLWKELFNEWLRAEHTRAWDRPEAEEESKESNDLNNRPVN